MTMASGTGSAGRGPTHRPESEGYMFMKMKSLLISIPQIDLLAVASTVAHDIGTTATDSPKDAMFLILRHTKPRTLLNRRRITKDSLVKYLHIQGIKVRSAATKTELSRLVLGHWGLRDDLGQNFISTEGPQQNSVNPNRSTVPPERFPILNSGNENRRSGIPGNVVSNPFAHGPRFPGQSGNERFGHPSSFSGQAQRVKEGENNFHPGSRFPRPVPFGSEFGHRPSYIGGRFEHSHDDRGRGLQGDLRHERYERGRFYRDKLEFSRRDARENVHGGHDSRAERQSFRRESSDHSRSYPYSSSSRYDHLGSYSHAPGQNSGSHRSTRPQFSETQESRREYSKTRHDFENQRHSNHRISESRSQGRGSQEIYRRYDSQAEICRHQESHGYRMSRPQTSGADGSQRRLDFLNQFRRDRVTLTYRSIRPETIGNGDGQSQTRRDFGSEGTVRATPCKNQEFQTGFIEGQDKTHSQSDKSLKKNEGKSSKSGKGVKDNHCVGTEEIPRQGSGLDRTSGKDGCKKRNKQRGESDLHDEIKVPRLEKQQSVKDDSRKVHKDKGKSGDDKNRSPRKESSRASGSSNEFRKSDDGKAESRRADHRRVSEIGKDRKDKSGNEMDHFSRTDLSKGTVLIHHRITIDRE